MNRSESNGQTDTEPLAPFEICVQSGQFAVRDALSQIFEALQPLELDVEETGTIEMVLAEVLNNVVEHAYPDNCASGPIRVNCTHGPDGLMLAIIDQGNAMPDGRLPLGEVSALDVDLDDLPEGGFGWFLIRNLAKDVAYARVNSENHTSMRLAIGANK